MDIAGKAFEYRGARSGGSMVLRISAEPGYRVHKSCCHCTGPGERHGKLLVQYVTPTTTLYGAPSSTLIKDLSPPI